MTVEADTIPPLEDQLCFAVYSTMHAFNRAYRPLLERLNLTYPQYLAMQALWQREGQNVKGLAERLQLDSGTMTPLLKRLESAGLIVRKRDPRDERHVIVALTERGRDLAGQARGVFDSVNKAVALPHDEARLLVSQLATVRHSLDQSVGHNAPGRA